jgi:prepilin-type processing-associated H-X9-DG protein
MEKVAFADALTWGLDYSYADPSPTSSRSYWYGGTPAPEGVTRICVAYRHQGKACLAFFDGHVERMEGAALNVTSLWY